MILVTGGTGNAGSEAVRALIERDYQVRVFVRDAERAEGLFGGSVELALGDFGDAGSVRDALEGVSDVVLSCADDPRRVEWETAAIDAAIRAGVRRIVKLSTLAASPGAPVAFWDWHGRVEQYLRKSGIAAVILQSSFYMSNLLAAAKSVAHEGRFYAPAGGARIAMIDPRDVGAAAAAVLASDEHDGLTYVLTGPEAITYSQVAAKLSAAIGRPVEFVDVPDDAARQGMVEAGMPDFVADQVVNIFEMLRQGVADRVTDTFASLTGAAPRDFAEFASDHARLFEPETAASGL